MECSERFRMWQWSSVQAIEAMALVPSLRTASKDQPASEAAPILPANASIDNCNLRSGQTSSRTGRISTFSIPSAHAC